MKRFAMLGWLLVAGTATAQEAPSGRAPFTGAGAGLAAGVQQHRVRIEFTDTGTGRTVGQTYRETGFGGGAFAGYDIAVAPRVRLGTEISGHVGGGDGPRVDFAGGQSFELRPRWGVTAVGRAGIVAGDRVLLYGTIGYGGYRYRLRTGVFIEGAGDWRDSVAYGGGVEYRLNERVGVRLDVRDLRGQATQYLVGVPVRF